PDARAREEPGSTYACKSVLRTARADVLPRWRVGLVCRCGSGANCIATISLLPFLALGVDHFADLVQLLPRDLSRLHEVRDQIPRAAAEDPFDQIFGGILLHLIFLDQWIEDERSPFDLVREGPFIFEGAKQRLH